MPVYTVIRILKRDEYFKGMSQIATLKMKDTDVLCKVLTNTIIRYNANLTIDF